ncbi:hypothetical protein SAMN05446037_101679 [Anaerovirgula multivorans]|uniref:Uncharacterized protein n=1 Tax=Anaerovirgula multivorans TaxID=312168 RepID=A0A239GES4_9FIRM|nr:hypothetical protein [Anaerovirgula multivorans]SNS67650.1 hypothetical protein SAMN05446037_101679 [Anaerovirgula multivorans]
MDSRKVYYKENDKEFTVKNHRLWLVFQIMMPFVLFILYLGGFLIVLQLPSIIPRYFSLEKFGEAGAVLRLTYWSNLAMLMWLILGTTILCTRLIIHCFKGNNYGKNLQEQAMMLKGKMGLSVILIVFAGFLSFVYLRDEKVLDIVERYHSDIALLKKEEIEIYEGMIKKGDRTEIEGGYYTDKPTPLQILNNHDFVIWEERKRFLCPNTLLRDMDIEKNEYYRISYLPYSKIVVSIEKYIP